MHIIVIRPDRESRRFTLGRRHAGVMVVGIFALALALGVGAYFLGHGQRGAAQSKDRAQVASLKVELAHKTAALTALQTKNQGGINAIAARMARLDAQVNQVAAMSAQVVKLAGLKNSSFDFNAPPGEGGVAPAVELPWKAKNLAAATNTLSSRVWFQERELSALETYLLHEKLTSEITPRGKPFAGGYVSSGYGWRTDPFNGEREFHPGIDLAGKKGGRVNAIAAGVVTWAGPRDGYGKLVIINDGNGYSTYYAHNEKVLARVGEIVHRGDAIALLGSTGRSTGPHVHIEVHYRGKAVNPWKYVIGKNEASG